ncbi:MAG: hypothetical protein HS112_03775 [Zoogloeaceae bacterium]|nr:hypothetical protein [Zoogloeaceae bacterium]
MQIRSKRPARKPRTDRKIPLVITRTVEVRDQPAVPEKHGKLNYQAKPKKPAKPAPKARRVERRSFAQGQYIGDGEKLIAFVWLDEDTAPKGEAANDTK